MEKDIIKIRIGSGSFNDIVIDDESVLSEHCNIEIDEHYHCKVINLHKAARTYINNEEVQWEGPIKAGDELRVGNVVVQWEEKYLSIVKTGQILAEIDAAHKEEKRLDNIAAISVGIFYIIYMGLALFCVMAIISGSKMLIIVSLSLFSLFVLYNIYAMISDFVNRKKLTDEECRMRNKISYYKRFILLIILPAFIIWGINKERNTSKRQYKKKYDSYLIQKFLSASSESESTQSTDTIRYNSLTNQ